LIDEVNDPDLTRSGEGHFGLLHHDGTPKPGYGALKNLIATLRDSEGHGIEPGWLTIQFSGAPSTMRFTLPQKASGEYYLALWNVERAGLRSLSGRRCDFCDIFRAEAVTAYAPNDAETGTSPTDAYTIVQSSRSITLRPPPHVLLLRIIDKSQ
jgi:hypothetical protein